MPAALGDQPHRGFADEILVVKSLAPRQRCDIAVVVQRFVVYTSQLLAERRADVGVCAAVEQQAGKALVGLAAVAGTVV